METTAETPTDNAMGAMSPALLAALTAAMSHRPSKHRAGWVDHFSKEQVAARVERKRMRRKMAKASRRRNRA